MSADPDRLIHRHLTGTLSDAESAELSRALREDPVVRRRLAELAFDETQLRELMTEAATGAVATVAPAPPARARWPRGPMAAAAAILLATGVALVTGFLRAGPPAPDPGVVASPVQDGVRYEVVGAAPVRVPVPEGSEATLAPAAVAVVRGSKVELERGRAGFEIRGAASVQTPAGRVSASDADFDVEIVPVKDKRPPKMRVSVKRGRAKVEAGDERRDLAAGEAWESGALLFLSGDVTLVQDDGRIQLRVRKASDESLVGKVLRVTPGAEPAKGHLEYLRRLRQGVEVSLQVRKEGEDFVLAALPPVKKTDRKEGDPEKPPVKEVPREKQKPPFKAVPKEGDRR